MSLSSEGSSSISSSNKHCNPASFSLPLNPIISLRRSVSCLTLPAGRRFHGDGSHSAAAASYGLLDPRSHAAVREKRIRPPQANNHGMRQLSERSGLSEESGTGGSCPPVSSSTPFPSSTDRALQDSVRNDPTTRALREDRMRSRIPCVTWREFGNETLFELKSHDSVKLIKFADDTTLIGLISNNDESAYRREVDRLVSWCSGNNLELNAQKTVEMIVDFRKSTVPPPPPSVMDSPISSVESFRFLGTTITQDLKWEPTISSLIKKAQQRMYFLRQLRKAKLPAQMLVQFYTAIIESILTSSVTVWFAGATVRDKQRLQRIVRSAEEVIGRSLPSLQDLFIEFETRSVLVALSSTGRFDGGCVQMGFQFETSC
uniref:Alkylated DNA repair protein AlkB homologue 8 N-terminal domain-containing protein n=1 Tax=Knipowitschia caucasica TaxID=637954 RepID=A0AAV2M524_KNICA